MLAGTAVGIAFLATARVRPFAGRLGDAGLSRQVAAVGAALCAIGGVGHLIAPDPVTRLVMGAGEAALFSGSLPRVMAGTPADRRGRVAGWFGLSMWGGLTVGPVVAVALANRVWSTRDDRDDVGARGRVDRGGRDGSDDVVLGSGHHGGRPLGGAVARTRLRVNVK